MRIRRVRMTTRRATAAVAVVAMILGGAIAWRRQQHRIEVGFYLQQAGVFDGLQRDFLGRAAAIERGEVVAVYRGEPEERAARAAWSRDQADGFARNARFFRHVATLPLLLEDPSLPEQFPEKYRTSGPAGRAATKSSDRTSTPDDPRPLDR